jgi:hypothetical protein
MYGCYVGSGRALLYRNGNLRLRQVAIRFLESLPTVPSLSIPAEVVITTSRLHLPKRA